MEARKAFYDQISSQNLTPLWEVLHALVPPQPRSPCLPAHWAYASLRPHLMRAGELISAEEAVRRVLILENPALRGHSAITQSLYAGLQLILPGEVAPAHRHTQSALRFIVEGQGAYTAVAGERTTMHPGDFIITPNWAWHDHGCAAEGEPVVWLDGLDIPMLRFFDAGFAETATAASQSTPSPEGTSFARWGANMAPIGHSRPFGSTSPIFSYPYSRSAEALHHLSRAEAPHPAHGHKLRYTNPQTGGWAMPTLGTALQLLPAGFQGVGYRQTAGQVFSVVEGHATARLSCGDAVQVFELAPRDHVVCPSWWTLELASAAGATLFSFSDQPVHEALGIFRAETLEK
jgi:gentisate 1,2-dioxygenase